MNASARIALFKVISEVSDDNLYLATAATWVQLDRGRLRVRAELERLRAVVYWIVTCHVTARVPGGRNRTWRVGERPHLLSKRKTEMQRLFL